MTHILIVDDDQRIRRALKETARLIVPNVQILEAQDGQEALIQAKQHRPHLTFLDFQLPELNGLQVVQVLKRMPSMKAASIVGMSGASLRLGNIATMRTYCNAWLTKPYSLAEILPLLLELVVNQSRAIQLFVI